MSSGPIVVMVLARYRAVSYWKELLGPSNSIRAKITHPHRYLTGNSCIGLGKPAGSCNSLS